MVYAVVFLVVTGVFTVYAIMLGGWGWLLLWPAGSFAIVGVAYAIVGVRIFGKRTDGTHRPLHVLGLLPFLTVSGLAWHLRRLTYPETIWHEIVPGIFAGRRAFPHELPPGIEMVVDLTSEFREPMGIRTGRKYRCLPILDAESPGEEELAELVSEILAFPGRIYIHCAQGHGRTGLVISAVLIARGIAPTAAEAVAAVRAIRPGVRLKSRQRQALERFASNWKDRLLRPTPGNARSRTRSDCSEDEGAEENDPGCAKESHRGVTR